MNRAFRIVLLCTSLLASTAAFAQTPVTTRQVGTATLKNVPEIPAEVEAVFLQRLFAK